MINRFLRAKHWEIFFLTIALPVVLTLVTSLVSVATNQDGDLGINMIMSLSLVLCVIMLLGMGGYFGWLWSIGMGVQHLIPAELRLNIIQFKISFFLPLVYIILLLLSVAGGIAIFWHDSEPAPEIIATILPLVVMFHFISIICTVFCFYFAAKSVKLAERQSDVTFGDFVGEFFMIWFFYIGVWVLQPKLNKLMEEGSQPSLSE